MKSAKTKLWAHFKLMRPPNSLLTIVAIWVGVVATGGNAMSVEALFAMISAFLVVSGGFVINDYYDREIDAINDPDRPIPSGLVTPTDAQSFGYLLMTMGVGVTIATLSVLAILIATTTALLLDLYSRTLKTDHAIVGNAVTSYSTAITYVFGWASSPTSIDSNLLATLASMFSITLVASLGREFMKAIDDVKGDQKCGIKTAAVKFGVRGAAWMATIFVISSIVLSTIPWAVGVFGNSYIIGFVLVDGIGLVSCFWLMNKIRSGASMEAIMKHAKYSKNLLLIGMGIGVVSFALGKPVPTRR